MQKFLEVKATKEFAETFLADPILKMAVNAVLNNAPAADVVEVVHGQWITEYWKSGYIKRCYCSRCGESPKDAYNPDNYCPKCGAKMDGGKDDGSA